MDFSADRWPDYEAGITRYLREVINDPQGRSARVGTSTPANLETLPLFIRVTRGPGSDDTITDSALVDIEVFATNRESARDVAEDVRQAMLGVANRHAGDMLVDSVTTASSPAWLSYDNPAIQRYVASYRVDARRKRASF